MLRYMALTQGGWTRAARLRNLRLALGVVLVAVLALAALAACGPEETSGASGDANEQTLAIARQFLADGNGDAARTALSGLDVANPSQWLTYMTENAVVDPNADPESTKALVALALEVGIREATIRAWAVANGLEDPDVDPASAATVAAAVQAPVESAPAAAPAEPVVAAAPLTSSTPLSGTAVTGVAAAAGSDPVQIPTATPAPAEIPTATPAPATASVTTPANLRQGPGTDYALAGAFNTGDVATITGKNATGDWWQVTLNTGAAGWVYGPLVTTSGPVESVVVVADIPAPPPVAAAPAPAAPVEAAPAAPAPAEAAPAEAAPAPAETAAPAPAAPDPSAQPHFTMVERRMWSKEENGGCAGQHLLRIIVLDAGGSPLNGVTLRGIYTGQELTTGSQGKGDGRIEFDLYGTGEGFKVIRNNDGREATSDNAEGFTTKSLDIDFPTLIGGGYCYSDADCQVFYNSYGCTGHHSWQATFKRNY